MSIEPIYDDGPSAPGIFQACTGTVAIAATLTGLRDALTQTIEGTLLLWRPAPTAFPPPVAVWQSGHDFLICYGGMHAPFVDSLNKIVGGTCPADIPGGRANAAFAFDPAAAEDAAVLAVLPEDRRDYTFYLAGHSGGGAAAFQFALWLYAQPQQPRLVEVVTFGEPRSLVFGYSGQFPPVHYRLINPTDPIPSIPPERLNYTLLDLRPKTVIVGNRVGQWVHHGDPFALGGNSLAPTNDTGLPDGAFLRFEWNGMDHDLIEGYYAQVRNWYAQVGITSQDKALFFAGAHARYELDIPPGDYGPPSAAAVNAGYFPGVDPGPATEQNLPQWAAIQVAPVLTFFGGGSSMPQFRGEFFFNQAGQGFSETLHSYRVGSLATYDQVLKDMQAVLPARQKMMITSLANVPAEKTNVCSILAIRVSDDLLKRDGIIKTVTDQATAALTGTVNNMAVNNCWAARVYVAPQYWSLYYLHAVALDSIVDKDMQRRDQPPGFWLSAFNTYIQQLQNNYLGTRFATFPWWTNYPVDLTALPFLPQAPSAMSSIVSCVYNPANDGTWLIGVNQNMPTKRCTMRLTQFSKGLSFLNGRRPCEQVGLNVFKVLGNFPSQPTWTSGGDATPIVWVNAAITSSPAASVDVLTTRKCGAVFGLERGRIRRRQVS